MIFVWLETLQTLRNKVPFHAPAYLFLCDSAGECVSQRTLQSEVGALADQYGIRRFLKICMGLFFGM